MNGLEPGATYEITGTYTYQMSENESEVTETFYQEMITMNDISSLGPIVVSFEPGSIFSNKIQLNNLEITEESDQEALYGLSRAIVEINGEQYNVGTQIFTSLSNKNPVTYESPELLDSNQTVDFTIIMRDSYGNNLPMSNNTGSTRTAKKVPVVTITTIKNEVNDLQIKINLDNDDNVVIENYRYVIYTSTGEIFLQDSVPADGILKLTNLNSEDWYQIFVYGSYDIEDGNGKVENIECIKAKLVEKEGETRKVPVYIENSNYIIPMDYVVMAVGGKADKEMLENEGIALTNKKYVEVDENGKTSHEKVFAGGDVAGQNSTVAWAARDGREIANRIYLFS